MDKANFFPPARCFCYFHRSQHETYTQTLPFIVVVGTIAMQHRTRSKLPDLRRCVFEHWNSIVRMFEVDFSRQQGPWLNTERKPMFNTGCLPFFSFWLSNIRTIQFKRPRAPPTKSSSIVERFRHTAIVSAPQSHRGTHTQCVSGPLDCGEYQSPVSYSIVIFAFEFIPL